MSYLRGWKLIGEGGGGEDRRMLEMGKDDDNGRGKVGSSKVVGTEGL